MGNEITSQNDFRAYVNKTLGTSESDSNVEEKAIVDTYGQLYSKYAKTISSVDNREMCFIADPSQNNQIVSEGQSWWQIRHHRRERGGRFCRSSRRRECPRPPRRPGGGPLPRLPGRRRRRARAPRKGGNSRRRRRQRPARRYRSRAVRGRRRTC